MSPARRSRLPQRPSPLLVFLLSLVILLPALPMQPAAASPGESQPDVLSAQEPTEPLIAFLRQGNLWLMNADGADQRQIANSESPVEDFAWSPSGRYIPTRDFGSLPRVEPGAASDPADQSTEVTGSAVEVPATAEPVETDASGGGPPSIYDAPASDEIVPIEPEGEGD